MKKWDLAISFAGEDRAVANEVSEKLKADGVNVFYDSYNEADLWGKDLYEYLTDIYRNKAKYCIMLISKSYAEKLWTRHERKAAQSRAFNESREYILPVRLDDTEIPGILDTTGYIDLRCKSIDELVDLILIKLWGDISCLQESMAFVKIIFSSYQKLMALCQISFIPNYHCLASHRGLAPEKFVLAMRGLVELKEHVKVNNGSIDSMILAKISDYIKSFDEVLYYLKFIYAAQSDRSGKIDFIGEYPLSDLSSCFEFVRNFSRLVKDSADLGEVINPSIILDSWRAAEAESPNFFSTPESYVFKDEVKAVFFSIGNIKKAKGMKGGQKLHVYDVER